MDLKIYSEAVPNVDSDHRDLVVVDDLHSTKSFDVNGEEVSVRAEEELATETEDLDESEHDDEEYFEAEYIDEMKTPRKKKNRKNLKRSRKKLPFLLLMHGRMI